MRAHPILKFGTCERNGSVMSVDACADVLWSMDETITTASKDKREQ